jgi:CDP-paratose 2-epimerase
MAVAVIKGLHIVGIDNDIRRQFSGEEASMAWNRQRLERALRSEVA